MKARENPFAVDRVLQWRYRPQGWDWPWLLQRLDQLRYRAAILGPEGSGKTTLLEDLRPHLHALGYQACWLQLTSQQRHLDIAQRAMLSPLGARDVLLLDGAEQMGRWRWWWLRYRSRRWGGLIVTSHQPGLLPTLVQTASSAEVFRQMVQHLLDGAEVPSDLEDVLREEGGNLRGALRRLYLRWAHRQDV